MPQIYLANTDNTWFDFLKARAPLEDVNFWKPTPQTFKAIDEGQLFAFRLKSPRNLIGGYGILASSINVPIQLAWESLGERNGSPSMAHMISAIRKYRSDQKIDAQSRIGCRVLTSPVFLEQRDWFEVPGDWSNNIVTGKVYDSKNEIGAKLLADLEKRTQVNLIFERHRKAFEGSGFAETEQARYGTPILVTPRLGQGAFRIRIAEIYGFECAISDTRVLPALEAAHIRPYSDGGSHDIANGIFLRKDIHSVLDAGFATISDDFSFYVSRKITEVFNNGQEYKKLHGLKLKVPLIDINRPSLENLRWHQTQCFVGD